jgi:regulator of sigma E protease
MSGFLIAVVSVVVILGFMILIHEFGHYAVAKLLKVRVEVFSIGFGKRLLGFRKGETDYRIAAIPLGGYVKMSGENPMDQRTDDPAEFMNHPRWHRFLIAIAGPAMNILFAIGLLTAVYMIHYEYAAVFDQPAVIAWVKPDSAAAQAGLQSGDRIVRIEELEKSIWERGYAKARKWLGSESPSQEGENPNWEQVYFKVMLNPNQPVGVTIDRDGQTFQRTIYPKAVSISQYGSAGWSPKDSVIVGKLQSADMPAARAGVKAGDRILALDGKPLPGIEAMIYNLQQTKEKPVELTVLRDGRTLKLTVNPVLAPTEDSAESLYRIGFLGKSETKVRKLGFHDAFAYSLQENKKGSLLILQLVEKLLAGKISPKTISGPIGIAQDAGEAAQQEGWTPLMALTAGISLNLGIFNLLPIPILDGGVIVLLLIEGLLRRDISLRFKERIYQVAFVFLILFAAMVIFNDLQKIAGVFHRSP